MSDTAKLTARVEALAGGDREVDAELLTRFEPDRKQANPAYFPSYTASLDAALALVELVRPSAFVTLDRYYISDDPKPNDPNWRVWLRWSTEDYELHKVFSGLRPTPALALLAALLRSLDAEPTKTGEVGG